MPEKEETAPAEAGPPTPAETGQASATPTAAAESATAPAEPEGVVGHMGRQRVRFLGVRRTLLPGRQVRVQVSLEWNGELQVGEEVGEAGTPPEMRAAATAAVKAVQGILPEALRVRLIGVKQIRAFDQEITVVSLLRDDVTPQRLVGAVLTTDDPLRTAALAVLNSLNRVLGNYLSTGG